MKRWFGLFPRRPAPSYILLQDERYDLIRNGFVATNDSPPTRADLEAIGILRVKSKSTPDRSGVDSISEPVLDGSLVARRQSTRDW